MPPEFLFLSASTSGLKSMVVSRSPDNLSTFFLSTYETVLNPVIGQYLVHCSSLFRVEVEHAAHNVSRLPRKQPQQPQRTFDDNVFRVRITAGRLSADWFRLWRVTGMMVMVVMVMTTCRGSV